MKYHNFKRPLAVILASLLTFSSASFVASAQETGEENQGATAITYTFRGESSNDDGTGNYTVDVLANGGKINTGFVEITYDADLYSGVTFTPAKNIKDASFYWDVDNEAGTYGVGFMSAAGLSDEDAGLFADIDNPSTTIAYIDASGTDDVRIGTFTLTFAEGNSYATAFTKENAKTSAVKINQAKYILHDLEDEYNTAKVDANTVESTMLVFSADDFTVADTETTYNGNAQEPTVTSDVAEEFTLDLNGAETQTKAGTYAIKVKNVSGEGYYDAEEIDLAKNFVIKKKEVTITAPTADPAAAEYVPNGFDPADITLSSEDWEVTDTALLNVGVYNVNVKYVGAFDTDNNIYKFNEAEVSDKEAIVATVAFEVTKAEGEVPALTTTYDATYDSAKDQTVTGYGVELSEGWEWVDANSSLSIGDNKDIAVKFIPEDVANYTYVGYDAELGYVPGKVTVTLNKAEGTAPALPVVTASVRRDTLDTVIKASDLVTNAGEWSYNDAAELTTGDNTIAFTYKPNDLDKVDYEGLANWNAETNQFEYSVTVKVLAPYFDPTGIYPPTNPAAVNFEEGKTFTAVDFALANDWEYAEAFELTSAGTTEDVKVLYEIPAGYDGIDPAKTEYTVEDGNIVYYVDLTVNRIAIPDGAITFSQTSDYTGSAIVLEKPNIAITGLTGVTADNVTLVAVADVDAGTYDVLATVAETTNYNAVTTAVKIGTLTITPAEVTADKFTLEYTTVEYDGNAKMPTVIATAGVGAVATVKYYNNAGTEVETPTDYGTYTVKVSGPANGNYKEYTDFEVGTFSITKHQVTITAPTALDPVNYVPGGYDLANLVVTGWTVVTTGKLNAGEHDVTIAYAGDLDTTNYTYIYNGTEVTDKASITAILKLTVNKGRIIIQKPEVGYDVDYVEGGFDLSTVKIDGWTTISTQKVGAGKSSITVEYAGTLDTDNYEYVFDGATVTSPPRSYPTIIVRKINLPADPLKIDDNDFTYNGSAQKATVSLKNTLTGVGTIAVTYKQGETVVADPTDAGTYDVYATVATGNNYYGLEETKLGSYEIKKATVEKTDITVADTEHTYDGNKKAPTATSAKGGTAVVTVTGEAINAGTYTFTVSGEATTNYEAYSFTYENGLVINRANVKESDFAVSGTSQTYDGSKKNPTVAKVTVGIGDPAITINGEAINAGNYTYTVSGGLTTNYNEYSFEYTNGFEITKRTITIAKPAKLEATDYVPGGVLASGLTYPANWAYNDEADKKLEAGVDQAIKVKYTATLDTKNNDYVAAEGVEGDATNGFTYTVTITVNQIAGTIPALTTSYEATYDKEKADKKVTTYVTIESADWVLTDKEAVLEYKADNKYAVETVLDTKNYTYAAVQGVTVGDGKATAEITVKFNKAPIPADGFSIAKVETEYNGDDKSVEVVKNDTYNGLGDATIVYHEGRTDAGTYDVKIIVSEGDNYVGSGDDGIVFEDVLVITKNKLSSIDTPAVATEMIVGTVITGDAGNNWTYVDTTIVAGDNTVTVTKTIDASTAKNYDFKDAADAAGVVITPITEGENVGGIVLTKTYAVTGKYSTGTLNLTVNTDSEQTTDANTGDVTITILPEGGTAYDLTAEQFAEAGAQITVKDLVLTEGKYTITVKKQRYLAYVLTLNVTANSTTEKAIELVAGDIVGGEEGKEIMGDGVIDIDDFVIAIRAFDDASSGAVKNAADIDENGANNVTDLGFIKANFNKTTAGNCTEDTTNTNG